MDKPFVTIKYKTADGTQICVEISTTVKGLLEQSDCQIRAQGRQDRRCHTEYIDGLTDTTMVISQEDFANLVSRMDSNKELYTAIEVLPVVQKKRIYLCYRNGLTCREIAKIEGVHHTAMGR